MVLRGETSEHIVGPDDLVLITGATGFIGTRVVKALVERGFRNLRCLVRPWTDATKLWEIADGDPATANIEVMRGNLLSFEDCVAAVKNVAVIIHLAAGRGEKSFPDAYMNSVVTTRNLIEAARGEGLRRFVNVSSFAVYSNRGKPHGRLLDESCPVEARPETRGEAYCFAKAKQDETVKECGERSGIPCVTIRPGYVYGPGKTAITGRVGIDSFGVFLHLGGSNRVPFTYVDNCAEAIVLAAVKKGVDGEVFNIVDDNLPTSRSFLRQYKRNVKRFRSIYLPHAVSYTFCWLWQKYAAWSQEQLPPVFSSGRWHANWKRTAYSNAKSKKMLGWAPRVSTAEGLRLFFESCRAAKPDA
jgi:nucleoside-diphosphate-sugar epimerase